MQDVKRCVVASVAVAAFSLAPSLAAGQGVSSSAIEATTMTADSGRPLAKLLDQVQHRFLSPITYEEAPFESVPDLKSAAVTPSSKPTAALSVTLGSTDTTPYFAAASVLHSYAVSGLPGVYKVVQNNGWVSVAPTQVSGSDGRVRDVVPVMGYAVTFPAVARNAVDTLQLIAHSVSRASGSKVILLNVPFWSSDTLTIGAEAQPARDVIESIGAAIGRPISFQCLYDPPSKAYYLNVTIVAPEPVPGTTTLPEPLAKPGVQLLGPPNSPWFTKQP